MKRYRFRLIFSLLFVLFLISPGAVSGMPAPASSECSLPPPSSKVAPTDTALMSHPSAPHEVEIRADKAVYVDEQNKAANWGGDDYIRVGIGPEFGGELRTLIHFGPVWESDGGPLPTGAEITGMRVKLYKESGPSGTVKLHMLSGQFEEDTVTWDTKPSLQGSSRNTSVPAANGWRYINAGESGYSYIFNDGIALLPAWTDIGRHISFTSDEHPSRGPSLVITYIGAEPPPEPPPTPPPADDARQCELTWTITPERPRVGESVTVTARATDDQAMWYVKIMRGSLQLARREAAPGERELEVSFTEEAMLPSLTYTIVADDVGPPAPVGSPIITVPVVGTGTVPEITVTAEWLDVEEVIPERYRLIRGDGQRVLITATASDPDGIRELTIHMHDGPYDFRYDDGIRTSVSETLEWVNLPGRTRFSYYASARDTELNYVTADGENFDIVGPTGILLMSTAAPGFHNPSRDRLPWTRMCQTFGDGECWWVKDWGWKSWYALIWYHAGFKEIADHGECFGMSTLATEIYHSRIAAIDLEEVSCAAYLSYDNTFTREIVESRQGGQMGGEVLFERINQTWAEVSQQLGWIERDLRNNDPGVLSIGEGDRGHAVVPWMSRQMASGTTRIYIYDCNREAAILETIREAHTGNPSFDFSDRSRYPYLELGSSSWSYQWDADKVWNDTLAYFSYEQACGDMGQENSLGVNRFAPTVTDHDIPRISQFLWAPIAGDADVYIEDEDGNVTGIYEGEIREEIPDSMAIIPMMGGPFSEHEMYMLPIDKKLKFHVVGKGEGEYVLGILGGGSVYSILDKALSEGIEDTITIEPSDDTVGHKLRIKPGKGDDDFTIGIGHMYDGTVEALDSDYIAREYLMEEVLATEDSDFSVYVEGGGDTLVVESYGDDIEFDVTMRSTESADYISPDEELPYIPGSTEEDVTVERGRRMEATAEDWATTEEEGQLHTLKKRAKGDGGAGFPIIPVVIGVAAAAAVGATVTVLLKRGVFGKAKKG